MYNTAHYTTCIDSLNWGNKYEDNVDVTGDILSHIYPQDTTMCQ